MQPNSQTFFSGILFVARDLLVEKGRVELLGTVQ
jgi:hypothetical protein